MMKKSLISAVTQALAVLCVALLGGCVKELAETPPSRRPLVVYMALDNDLRGSFRRASQALRAGWRPGMELWVYADTPEGASLGRMDSTPEGVALRTVERYGEENSASARRWSACFARYGVSARRMVTVCCSSRTPRGGFRRADCRHRS